MPKSLWMRMSGKPRRFSRPPLSRPARDGCSLKLRLQCLPIQFDAVQVNAADHRALVADNQQGAAAGFLVPM